MNLKEYHEKLWLPFSSKLYSKIKGIPPLRILFNLFNVHFSIFSILGIFKTPKKEIDCYWWMIIRNKEWKYKDMRFKTRIRIIKKLLRRAVK